MTAALSPSADSRQSVHRDLLSDWYAGPYYLPGEEVPAGRYRDVDTRREIILTEPGVLPATCDGHVAVYVPSPKTWEEVAESAFP